LFDPHLAGDSSQSVRLPLRQTDVRIRTRDTRHGSGYRISRGIDLGAVTKKSLAHYIIHNGLHCSMAYSCPWQNCADFALSDHYLTELRLFLGDISSDPVKEQGDFPRELHSKSRWSAGFGKASLLQQELSRIVHTLWRIPAKTLLRGTSRKSGMTYLLWFLDSCCWLQTVIGGFVRDSWVHPSGPSSLPMAPRSMPMSPAAIRGQLHRELATSCLPTSVISKCYKFLRPNKQQPPLCLRHEGVVVSAEESHSLWCTKLRSQCSGPDFPDPSNWEQASHRRDSDLGRAWAARGSGPLDINIGEPLVRHIIDGWQRSAAMPHLLPRAAVKCFHPDWIIVSWRLLRLAGPASWALRASIWRWVVLGSAYKKGSVLDIDSWRLLFISSQMGLLQEGLLAVGLRPAIRSYVFPGQSGYVRGCEDPLLVLESMAASFRNTGTCLYAGMVDFKQAFPRTWREDLLSLGKPMPCWRGGLLHLLGHILASGNVIVLSGGYTVVVVVQGLPEGRVLGPFLYPSVPDFLGRVLMQGCACVCHYSGAVIAGVVMGFLTSRLCQTLSLFSTAGRDLPESTQLSADVDLEASAAKTLDVMCKISISHLFHADDPVFFATSCGEMCRIFSDIGIMGSCTWCEVSCRP
jgi:hypothetical protein